MSLQTMRKELSIRGKNGIGFLLSGAIIWGIITLIFATNLDAYWKSIFMLIATGIMFPLSIGINQLMKADWKLEGNPLGELGLYLNLAQIIYLPIVFWALGNNPEATVYFFAIITGAHFFPYGWFYQTRAYYIMAPVISVSVMFIGWNLEPDKLWHIPLTMLLLLSVLIVWLYGNYYKKVKKTSELDEKVDS